MTVTFSPADRTSHEVMRWYEDGAVAAQTSEAWAFVPITDFFEEILCDGERNKPFAHFSKPKGHPSLMIFCMGILPHMDFEAILEHPNEVLMDLYQWIQTATKDLQYIRAKMTLRKA